MTSSWGRIQETHSEDMDRVLIGPRRNTFSVITTLFALAWCTLFALPVYLELTGQIPGDTSPAFIVPYLIFLAVPTVFAVANAFWNFCGQWEILVTNDTLTLKARLFRFQRSRSLSRLEVTSVRLHEFRRRGQVTGWAIVFDSRGKKVFATPRLSAEEAQTLVAMPFLAELSKS